MKKDSQSYSKNFTLCSSLKYDKVGILMKCFFEPAILINECQSAISFNSNVTWFLRGQASDKSWQCKKSRPSSFILDNRKGITVYLKDDKGKFWQILFEWKWSLLPFFSPGWNSDRIDVLAASNTNVKLVETPFCKAKTVSFWENTPTRPLLPGLAPGIVIPDLAHTLICGWPGYGFCPSVLNRMYNLQRVCLNYKQGIASTVDFICMIKFVSTPSTQKQWL